MNAWKQSAGEKLSLASFYNHLSFEFGEAGSKDDKYARDSSPGGKNFISFYAMGSELFDFHLNRFSIWRNYGRGQNKMKIKKLSNSLFPFLSEDFPRKLPDRWDNPINPDLRPVRNLEKDPGQSPGSIFVSGDALRKSPDRWKLR
jgi:hypothetical protein